MTNASADINGFNLYRCDRDNSSQKTRGGGVCAYINEKWCHTNNVQVIHRSCSPDLEILSMNLRPYYLPREIPKIVLNVVYVPPQANVQAAADTLSDLVHDQQSKTADAAIYVIGDFNQCTLDSTLPTFHQYVNLPTRQNKTLDLCYGSVPNAYKCVTLPPLGNADHNMTLLLPKYRPILRRSKPEKKAVTVWRDEAVESLRGCFECTDWSVFVDSSKDIDELCDTVTCYIRFCEDLFIERKEKVLYPNTKPWENGAIKDILKQKQEAFKSKCPQSVIKELNGKLQREIRTGKLKYRQKLEHQFSSGNSKDTWAGLKNIVGYKDKQPSISVDNEHDYANNLNKFYARFETNSAEPMNFRAPIQNNDPVTVGENEVRRVFESVSVRKACGPDGIQPFVLKTCASQLSHVFTIIINKSLLCCTVPSVWKCSEIVPVPKKEKVSELNDLRPVALTSVVMKCMEKIVLGRLKATFSPVQDPLQFAYREGRSVDDALLVFLDNVYKHLDRAKTYCRILFVDFSSAFNTIHPSILLDKLNKMQANTFITSWIESFLTNRTQYVKLNKKTKSSIITTNIGAPQGSVLSPVLFTIYTNDCSFDNDYTKLIKFADDSTIQGLIDSDCDETHYRQTIDNFVKWCDDHCLHLNVKKTKEIIIDFRRNKTTAPEPLYIKNERVEEVTTYKYLGVTIDNQLNWQAHASLTHKKANKRMYFLRKLRAYQIDTTLMALFYKATIESVLTFCIAAWGGNTRNVDKYRIDRVIKKASKISMQSFPSMQLLLDGMCSRKIINIMKDSHHPLAPGIKISPRSNRPILFRCRTERYKKSFLPNSMKLIPTNTVSM